MEVVSPGNFPPLGAQHMEDNSPLCDAYDVNGAGVPFSWEQKPGVPLVLSPIYLHNTTEKEVNHEEKTPKSPTPLQNLLQFSPNHLPIPPAALQISSTNVSNISSPLPFSSSSFSSPNTHTHKHKRISFHTHLNKKQAKNTTFLMDRANIITDDPFLKAIQACTEAAGMKEADQEKKEQHNPSKEAEERGGRIDASINNHSKSDIGAQKMSAKALFSNLSDGRRSPLRRKFDEMVISARSPLKKSFYDEKELNINTPLSHINGANEDKVLSTRAQSSKLDCKDFDGKMLSGEAQLNKANGGAFDDKMLRAKAQFSKANYGIINDKLVASYKSPITMCNGGFDDKGLRYDGHPAFMVATFHQSAKSKKPTPHKSHHQRSSSYGCMGCSSADCTDSIIRL